MSILQLDFPETFLNQKNDVTLRLDRRLGA